MPHRDKADPASPLGCQHGCGSCCIRRFCLPSMLDATEIGMLQRVLKHEGVRQRGDHLFRAGDVFQSLHIVRSGSFKVYSLIEGGHELVDGFRLPGEVLGCDAMDECIHPGSAQALETSSVCEIPFEPFRRLSEEVPVLRQWLVRVMSREISADHRMFRLLAKRTGEERLAIALISISERLAKRGLSPRRFRLSMSRNDLSNYLGLAPETMSRLFRRFRDSGWISLASQGSDLVLEDMQALHRLSGKCDETAAGLSAPPALSTSAA